MEDTRSFATFTAHVHDETAIKASIDVGEAMGQRWAQVQLGGVTESVNVVINVWDRDTLRRLADAAAKAYHDWTKAEADTAADEARCSKCGEPNRLLASGAVGHAYDDCPTDPVDPTGVDCAESYEGIVP